MHAECALSSLTKALQFFFCIQKIRVIRCTYAHNLEMWIWKQIKVWWWISWMDCSPLTASTLKSLSTIKRTFLVLFVSFEFSHALTSFYLTHMNISFLHCWIEISSIFEPFNTSRDYPVIVFSHILLYSFRTFLE